MNDFPVGGSKDAVFSFLSHYGFKMSSWSDKHFSRADGIQAHIYGAGSMCKVTTQTGALIADAPIKEAIAAIK